MDIIIPNRQAAERNGWTYQVQWIEDGNPCFVRCKSGSEADAWANRLRKQGHKPIIADLADLLQLH